MVAGGAGDAGIVRLEPGMTKDGQGRTIHLEDEIKVVIEKQRDLQRKMGKLTPFDFPSLG